MASLWTLLALGWTAGARPSGPAALWVAAQAGLGARQAIVRGGRRPGRARSREEPGRGKQLFGRWILVTSAFRYYY